MSDLSFRALVRFYLPLALSGLLIALQQPVIAAALARTANPQEALAAYGLALSVAVLLESPIQMLLATGAALAHDGPSFRLLQRFAVVAGVALSVLGAVLTFTPAGQALFRGALQSPWPVGEQALLALRVLLPWPLVVAWRRLYQGVLIRQGQTRAVGCGTAGRLVVIAAAAYLGVSFAGWPGVVTGASALLAGALVEALFATGWLWLATARMSEPSAAHESLTLPQLGRFYRPLALTAVLTSLSWPLINAGLGRAPLPERSLAAWPVILTLLWLFTTPLQMLQQVTIALVKDELGRRAVHRFALGLGAVAAGLLGLVAFTPLLEVLLLRLLAAPAHLAASVVLAGRWLAPFPFLTAVQVFYQGLLIGRQRTAQVRTAIGANLLMAGSVLVIGIHQGALPGFLLAVVALTTGLLAETAVLWWSARSQA